MLGALIDAKNKLSLVPIRLRSVPHTRPALESSTYGVIATLKKFRILEHSGLGISG